MNKTIKCISLLVLILVLILGCGINRDKPDDVKLIKDLVDRFQIAVDQRQRPALDSIYIKDQLSQDYRIPKLLQDFSDLGDLRNIRFIAKRFEIFGDSAAVLCTLLADNAQAPVEKAVKKPFEINLLKQKMKWRIIGHKLK